MFLWADQHPEATRALVDPTIRLDEAHPRREWALPAGWATIVNQLHDQLDVVVPGYRVIQAGQSRDRLRYLIDVVDRDAERMIATAAECTAIMCTVCGGGAGRRAFVDAPLRRASTARCPARDGPTAGVAPAQPATEASSTDPRRGGLLMPTPSASPAASTATRSGSRVVVTRTDDVIPGAEPLISIMAGNCEVLTFSPMTALELAGMLARAAATTVAVQIKVTNSYPYASFERIFDVEVPTPRDTEYLDDWCYEYLYEYTGEGPEYASTPGAYEVEILSAPIPFAHLVGLTVDSYG